MYYDRVYGTPFCVVKWDDSSCVGINQVVMKHPIKLKVLRFITMVPREFDILKHVSYETAFGLSRRCLRRNSPQPKYTLARFAGWLDMRGCQYQLLNH